MIKFHGKTFLIAVFLVISTIAVQAQYPDTMKIMTYNINAEGHGSGSYSDIATVINTIAPAIVGLQKLDSCNDRNSQYVLKYLGEQTAMNYTFAAAIPNYKGSTGSYGIGFLSNNAPLKVRKLSIPSGSASIEDRAALEIGITLAGEPVRVIVTHLAHGGEGIAARISQIQKIIPWIDSGGSQISPVIIMADYNSQPGDNAMKLFEQAGFVYVKGKNGEILDTTSGQGINHILYRPESRWKVVDAGNPSYTASNRNPVWALISLLNPVAAKQPQFQRAPLSECRTALTKGSIEYQLIAPATVSLHLYNSAGRNVRTILNYQRQNAGNQKMSINVCGLSEGIYYFMLSINRKTVIEKTAILH